MALALAVIVIPASSLAARLLARSAWPHRAPHVAIWTWLSLVGSTFAALVLTALAAATALLPGSSTVFTSLQACAGVIPTESVASMLTVGGLGVSALLFLLTRLGLAARITWRRSRAQRAAHQAALDLVTSGASEAGYSVLPHSDAAAFCVAGRRPMIVVTAGAIERLSDDQLAGVLAHEHAHVNGRHHLLLAVLETLECAAPWLAVFGIAREQLPVLIEMRADDVASRKCSPAELAEALLSMAESPAPQGTLAAARIATIERVERLARPPAPLASPIATGVALVGASPVAVIAACALTVVVVHAWAAAGIA